MIYLYRCINKTSCTMIYPIFGFLLLTLMLIPNAYTHDGETPVHYVALTGEDSGLCDKPVNPCRTLDYVMGQAEKGDRVLVAAGNYEFRKEDPDEIVTLLSPIVQVTGGYSVDDGFKVQDASNNKTIINGVVTGYAQRLASNGFISQANAQTASEIDSGSSTNGKGTSRYVSDDGLAQGECSSIENACNLARALEVVHSGDSVLIAAGDYVVSAELAQELLRSDISIIGGVSKQAGFVRLQDQQIGQSNSYITGPSFKQREELARRGLTLIQDRKGMAITESITRAKTSPQRQQRLAITECDQDTGTAGPYPCKNIDLLSQMPLAEFSSAPQAANDIWGFVDLRDENEYAIIGLLNGTAVVNVTDPENPMEVGTIAGRSAQWRDIKVYQNKNDDGNWQAYAYVTADNPQGGRQGLQIIDLTGLPDSVSLAASWDNIGRAHNVYISNVDYSTGVPLSGMQAFVYIAGADRNSGAALGLEVSNPTAPTEVLVAEAGTQYIHDGSSMVIDDARTAQCKSGANPPDDGHNPCEVFIDFNENTLDIWDVTDKQKPLMISSIPYPDAHYTHSGWWSEDKNFVFLQDELDEQNAGLNTTMRTVDISDLSAPELTNVWTGPTRSIDHNGFTKGNRYYMSNYRRGLTVLDVSDPNSPIESAFFDTFPVPEANSAQFNGAWGVYPFLPSGSLLVSDIEGGLFVLREIETSEAQN